MFYVAAQLFSLPLYIFFTFPISSTNYQLANTCVKTAQAEKWKSNRSEYQGHNFNLGQEFFKLEIEIAINLLWECVHKSIGTPSPANQSWLKYQCMSVVSRRRVFMSQFFMCIEYTFCLICHCRSKFTLHWTTPLTNQ